MLPIIKACLTIALFSWSYQIKTQEQQMLNTAIKAKDIEQVRKYLDDGGNINLSFGDDGVNLVLWSLLNGAEEIAEMLIKRGADYKSYCKFENVQFNGLGLAIIIPELSTNLVKTLLEMRADIDSCVRTKTFFGKTNTHSLISFTDFSSTLEKQQFIINFLMEKYQRNLLETAIEQDKIRVKNIKPLVEAGAHVSPLIVQKAIALKKDKEIVQFLQYQVGTQETLYALLPFSKDVSLVVARYAQGRLESDKEVPGKQRSKKCIIM